MIRQVDKSSFNIPIPGNPMLHRELGWYATDGDAVIGVVVLDLAYQDYSWFVLTQSDRVLGYGPVASYRRGRNGSAARRHEVDTWQLTAAWCHRHGEPHHLRSTS